MFHDLLDNGQAKTDAIAVLGGGPLKFAETREKLGYVILGDACTSIDYMHNDAPQVVPIACLDLYFTVICKLDCVLHQIDHYLLESTHVTDNFR